MFPNPMGILSGQTKNMILALYSELGLLFLFDQ